MLDLLADIEYINSISSREAIDEIADELSHAMDSLTIDVFELVI